MCCLPSSISKLLLIVFNIIFFILGLGLIVLGILLLIDKSTILEYVGKLPIGSDVVEEGIYGANWLKNFAYMLIIAGGIFFIIGGAGLCGACCKNECLLIVYATIVTLIVILEIGAGVVAIFFKDKVESFLKTFMTDSLQEYYTGMTYVDGTIALSTDTTGVSDGIDFMQIEFECCGVNNQTDWVGATAWSKSYTVGGSSTPAVVPISCCILEDKSLFPDSLGDITFAGFNNCIGSGASGAAHQTGCYQAIYDKLMSYSLAVIITAIVFGAIEILGIWAACSLYRNLNKEKVNPI